MKVKLYCIPYAGGSANIYMSWKPYLEHYDIEIRPLELKGRGKRFCEELYQTIHDAVDDLYENIISDMDNADDYAIYGHSMGCILAYELWQKIYRTSYHLPKQLFLSGRYPPDITKTEKKIHLLDQQQFFDEIISLGGTEYEVFENPELSKLFEPIIRADYRILENYVYDDSNSKIITPVTIINGNKDEIILKYDMNKWMHFCDNEIDIKVVEGNHFFIKNNITDVTYIVRNKINNKGLYI